jgi:molybdate transport system substrate-binding protein
VIRPVSIGRLLCGSFLLAIAACGRAGDDERLLVLAASDLQFALPELASEFEAEHGVAVDVVLGSTGNLTAQIENGAPADLFMAANERFIDRLETAGLTLPETRRVYAVGRLVVAVRAGTELPTELDELVQPGYATIAIANPEHAPYGQAAREAMAAVGVWRAVESRLVLGESVSQAFQYVRGGNADAGIVALSIAIADQTVRWVEIPADLHAPLRQAAAVLRGSRRTGLAAQFLDYVVSDEGQAILRRYGFEPPDS